MFVLQERTLALFCFLIFASSVREAWCFLDEKEPVVTCNSQVSCPGDSCCIYNKLTNRAICQPKLDVSSLCYYQQLSDQSLVVGFDQCPCKSGLECFPVNGTDPVYGQIGYCIPSTVWCLSGASWHASCWLDFGMEQSGLGDCWGSNCETNHIMGI